MGYTRDHNSDEEFKVRFSVYSLTRPEGLRYFDGEDSREIEFFSSSRSDVYDYEGNGTIYFFRESPAPTEEDPAAVTRDLVGRVNISPPGGDFLFVFFPDASTERELYRIFPIVDSAKDLPPGSIRIFNATRWKLLGMVDGKRQVFESGPSPAIRVSGETFNVGLGLFENGKVHQGFNGPLRMDRGSRGLLFVFPPFVKGSAILQVRFLNEGLPNEYRDRDDKLEVVGK